ncbi:fumarylacetoacetate hydrolase family protein [Arvimicrobium flavum]|uniref:fumarylacetoacetate hydrolase family protein n=1 Tax=Arvimicrobium flavum TaxID=3393320 RepID=UPI00237B1539|nr:fumarylacetoacetate hydrolase family protein [Mesorhizobium shangrilense]
MTELRLAATDILPTDGPGQLVGRVWSNERGGPCPVVLDRNVLRDLSPIAPTMSGLLELAPDAIGDIGRLPTLGGLDDFLSGGFDKGSAGQLLAPCDLQAVKAAGVTFAGSMLERVIEERAKGEPERAEAIRRELAPVVGESLRGVEPGSEKAAKVKALLQERGLWSQYLEVGIGPDAEVFTKAQPMSSVGCGARVGVNAMSSWNNPEPEVVLAVNSRGEIRGAALGNDVNLRDVEGRSALLLGKAKDNNGACAIGPFIRLFDAGFGLADVEAAAVSLQIIGQDGFTLEGESLMSTISRPPAEIVRQTIGKSHQYPDGFMLFLGTMFAPVKDRHAPGQGFTHEIGDEVRISSPKLGALINVVDRCDVIDPWVFGTRALMENLAGRGLLR